MPMFRSTLLVVCVLALPVLPASAQGSGDQAGRLRVTVADPSGAVIPTARVTVSRQDRPEASPRPALLTGADGSVTVAGLAPGVYAIVAGFPGFETVMVRDFPLRAGENERTIALPIRQLEEDVVVGRDERSAAIDPRGDAFSTVLTREMIDALPDDPDEMEAALKAMSPPGSVLRVDGFSGGRMPPKEQIRSIRLPRMDMMAAQNHGGAMGMMHHIDVLTQPGSGPLRGSLDITLRDDALNARNPFAPVKGDEALRRGGVTLSGGLVPNRSSFSFTVRGASIYDTGTLLAATPDGEVADAVRRPSDRLDVFARFDQSLGPAHALRVMYSEATAETRNLGVGGFDLPERAFESDTTQREVRVSENGPVGRRGFSESRALVRWTRSQMVSALESPTVRVLDAFTAGGAQRRGGRRSVEFEAATDFDYVRGAHSMRAGVLLEGGRYRSDDITNYLGTYTFASLADYAAGRAATFTRRLGDPAVAYTNVQLGAYVQDDFRLSRGFLLSYGLRYETQNLLSDRRRLLPRVSVSWSPTESGRTTVRGGWGRFSDWLDPPTWEQALRFDGSRQREILTFAPDFSAPDEEIETRPSNRYSLADDVRLPGSVGGNIGIDQRLTEALRLTGTYSYRRGSGLLRGRNLNPDVNGVRPDPAFANVVEAIGDAESRYHALTVSASLMMLTVRQTFFAASYTLTSGESSTAGAFQLPASGENLDEEWGATVPRHRFGGAFNMRPVAPLGVALNFRAQSGTPYDVTTGTDDNGDGVFNDRAAGVPRNSALTAVQWDVGLRVSYAIGFGGPRQSGGGQAVVMVSGGGGGMPSGMPGGSGDDRYRVEFYVAAQNVTDRRNYVGYSGVMTSPFFGRPTNVMNPRKIEIGARFGF